MGAKFAFAGEDSCTERAAKEQKPRIRDPRLQKARRRSDVQSRGIGEAETMPAGAIVRERQRLPLRYILYTDEGKRDVERAGRGGEEPGSEECGSEEPK